MFHFNTSEVATREHRLGSITGYNGNLQDLVQQSADGTLKNRDRCFSQSSSCDSGCALGTLLSIRDIAVIYHAPAGCSCVGAGNEAVGNQLAASINVKYNSVMVSTDMDENDTIFGALPRTKKIAEETFRRYHPRAMFIASSCVSGCIGEDIDSITDELEEEFGIPVVAIHCEGFKSRIWASGFDITDHAILTKIVKPPKEKRPVINFKNFYESHRPEITKIFRAIGVEPLFLYSNVTIEQLSHISESLATVCVCGTLGTYIGNGLEEKYGVPYIRTINPMGVKGFETWFREIGKVIGKSEEVEKYIQEQREIYIPKIEEAAKDLKGLRAVIGMGPGYTYEISRVLEELGMEVVWALAWHYDYKYDDGNVPPALKYLLKTSPNNIPLSVADQQNFEVLNILNTYKPDVYFSRHPGTTVWAIKQGISAVYVADEYMCFGYEGTLRLVEAIRDAVTNRSFETNLAKHCRLPYTDWWYQQPNDTFLNQGKGAAKIG